MKKWTEKKTNSEVDWTSHLSNSKVELVFCFVFCCSNVHRTPPPCLLLDWPRLRASPFYVPSLILSTAPRSLLVCRDGGRCFTKMFKNTLSESSSSPPPPTYLLVQNLGVQNTPFNGKTFNETIRSRVKGRGVCRGQRDHFPRLSYGASC